MVIPEVARSYWWDFDMSRSETRHGSVSGLDDRVKTDREPRRIGFVRECAPDDSWRMYADYV